MVPNNKCSAAKCSNDSVGTISRYGDNRYCHAHLKALLAMNVNRRPKPVITLDPGFDPNALDSHESKIKTERIEPLSSSSKIDEVRAIRKSFKCDSCKREVENTGDRLSPSAFNLGSRYYFNEDGLSVILCSDCSRVRLIKNKYQSEHNNYLLGAGKKVEEKPTVKPIASLDYDEMRNSLLKKYKRRRKVTLGMLIIAVSIFSFNYISSQPEKRAIEAMAISAIDDFESLKSSCMTRSDESLPLSTGLARSNERSKAVQEYFAKLAISPCFIEGEVVYSNPYKSIDFKNLSTADYGSLEYDFYQGLLFAFDYGFSQFTSYGTICADGWISRSSGRGSCSWHGGYARARGSQLDFNKGQVIDSPGTDTVSLASKLGVGFSIDLNPEVKPNNPSVGQTCVFGPQNDACFNYPNFNIVMCSDSITSNLEVLVDKWWQPAWEVNGIESDKCPKSEPFLLEAAGSTLRSSEMRFSLSGGNKVSFVVNSNA